MKRPAGVLLESVVLDPSSDTPLYRQLFLALRDKISGSPAMSGSRLPSSRALARDLGVSRNTVVAAYNQLTAEGFLEARLGSGCFVSDQALAIGSEAPAAAHKSTSMRLSHRGRSMASLGVPTGSDGRVPFTLGVPSTRSFPSAQWGTLLKQHARAARPGVDAGDPQGLPALRTAVARHLIASRSVRCSADQVIILPSSQLALDLLARVLADEGEPVLVEHPGYFGAVGACVSAGLELRPLEVDEEGAITDGELPSARFVYTTPSHQFPLGHVLTLPRRYRLLEWANEHDAWIIEDDYDGEFRYEGPNISSLQGLDRSDRTFYVGTFSKSLFPGLRLAYVVAPPGLVSELTSARRLVDGQPSSLGQAALADFITRGHYSSHLRRMRRVYAGRQKMLIDVLRDRCPSVTPCASGAGLHLVVHLPADVPDVRLAALARTRGLVVSPLSSEYWTGEGQVNGLVLGYAGLEADAIAAGVEKLREVVEHAASTARTDGLVRSRR